MNTKINVINFVPEELPSYRPDVDVLYSKELPKEGVNTTIVGMPKTETVNIQTEGSTLKTSKKTANRHLDSVVYFFNAAKLAFSAKKKVFNLFKCVTWSGSV